MGVFLQNGARVGIIGGGPAGSFTAIHLLNIAASLNKTVEVFIFEKKDFTSGKGCNFCAGILSNTLIKELSSYNITIPPEVIQRVIKGYYYETIEGTAYFPRPPDSTIYSVFRANGTRISKELYNSSFDYFLLQEAVKRGAYTIESTINKIIIPSHSRDRVSLYAQEQDTYYEFDLVFGACGINSLFTKELEKSGIGYKAPRYIHSSQAEIFYDNEMSEKLSNNVIIFLIPFKDLYFFSFTPKKNYITITAIGPYVTREILEELFTIPQVMKYFPDTWQVPLKYCHCHPRLPVSIAQNFFYHRVVVVGDACWSKYLKDGITSAFYTSKSSVECVFKQGIAYDAFQIGYSKKIARMDKDNTFGKLLFKLHSKLSRSPIVRSSLYSMTVNYSSKTVQQISNYILWGLFTGDYSYRNIMKKALTLSYIVHFIKNIMKAYLSLLFYIRQKLNKKR